MYVYVGSRTSKERNANGKGISIFEFDSDSSNLTLIQELTDLVNPSFLAIDKAQKFLYTVHGDRDYVSSFAIDEQSGRIRPVSSQSTCGMNPVHVALDPSERYLIVSNHLSSSLVVLPVDPKGVIKSVSQELRLAGPIGPHRVEQPHSKPHFNLFDPSGRFVIVPDKGLDRVFSFQFADGRLSAPASPFVNCRENAGPRNVVFHPVLSAAYVINELDSTITLYDFDPATGALLARQIVSTLPQDFTGNSRASSIAVTSCGRFLYASNRGADNIAIFAIDAASGWLSLLGAQSSLGKTPRFFALDPAGRFLFVANEESHSLVIFSRDPQNGWLAPVGQAIHVGSPVSIVFKTR